jgi:hypothetical protein
VFFVFGVELEIFPIFHNFSPIGDNDISITQIKVLDYPSFLLYDVYMMKIEKRIEEQWCKTDKSVLDGWSLDNRIKRDNDNRYKQIQYMVIPLWNC